MCPITLLVLLASAAPARLDVPLVLPTARAQDPEPVKGRWTGSITAGGIVTSGNSETRNGNATADAEYRREKDRVTLGFLWNYAEEKNTTGSWNLTDRRTSGKAKYDYFFTEKTYGLVQTSAEADEAADLDLRWTLGAGVGRQFQESERWKLSAEAGLAWFDEEYETTSDEYVAGRLAYNAAWKPHRVWELGQTGELFPSLEDSDDVNAKVDTRAKVSFTESMFGQLQWVFDWDNTPATGKEREDHRFLLSVGWKF